MKKKKIFFISIFLMVMSFGMTGTAADQLKKVDTERVVKIICEKILQIYPYKEVANKVIKGLADNLSSGKYEKCQSPAEFASTITTDMESLSSDKHLDIIYNPQKVAEMKMLQEKGVENTYTQSDIEQERMNNFGFKELKILDGNIGYMDLQGFFAAKYAGDTAVAAMKFFSNCDAIIIDLRKNGGGWDSMVNFLLSYFIDSEEEIVLKITRSTIDSTYYPSMTLDYIPGKKLDTLPVYILTAGTTASAAEAFTSRMKQLNKHVTTVGTVTAGAENPVEHQILDNDFILKIPCWQVVYSKGDSGWEGKGINPDIKTNVEEALEVAQLDALEKLKAAATNKMKLENYQWGIDGLSAKKNPYKIDKKVLRIYVGKYGKGLISIEKGYLYYKPMNRPKRKLVPIAEDYFLLDGFDYYRIRFLKKNNAIVNLDLVFNDGYVITIPKDK